MEKKVPITDQEKKLSYAKYYAEDMTPIGQANINGFSKPCPSHLALPLSDRNRLFEDGYLAIENGYCVMPDGTGFVANLTQMPGVTPDMFDWWFAWHGLGPLRYTIWNPEDHYTARCLNRAQALNPQLSNKEKYWGTTHLIRENIGLGVGDIFVTFRDPREMGFDGTKISTPSCGTIVTANGGSPTSDSGLDSVVMCHFVREIHGAIELRTRFWMGWHIVSGKEIKLLQSGEALPEQVPRALCMHAAKEFAHLARLLPRIYEEEKNHW